MGCGNSKGVPNTVVEGEMKTADDAKPLVADQVTKQAAIKSESTNDKKDAVAPVTFEIPVDELKVPANLPSTAQEEVPSKDLEQLKAELKAKEEQAEKNRQKELEKIQQKAQDREEQAKKAKERKKNNSNSNLDEVETGGEANQSKSNISGKAKASKSNLPVPKSNGSKANLKK